VYHYVTLVKRKGDIMSGIIKAVVFGLFGAVFDKIDKWLTAKRLEEAESKVAAANAYLKSQDEAQAVESEMKAAAKKVEERYDEAKTYKEKLDALRKFNEARRINKIKKNLPA